MNKHRNVHVLFSLSLFLLFVIGSFFIVTYEIKGYQMIDDVASQEDDLIVPLAYLNTKLKANDSSHSVQIVEVEDVQCLQIATSKTITYIYLQDGYLKELYLSNDYMPGLNEGNKLFAIDGLEMKEDNQLFKFTVNKNKQSKSISIYLHG